MVIAHQHETAMHVLIMLSAAAKLCITIIHCSLVFIIGELIYANNSSNYIAGHGVTLES